MDLAIGGHGALERDPGRPGIDEHEHHVATLGVRRHDDPVRQVCLGHRQLRAVEHPPLALRRRPHGR